MPYTLIIKNEANEDMAQAYLYYEKIRNGLGERFLSELSGSIYDTTSNEDYDSLTVYNVDEKKKYFVKLPEGEIKKALEATEEMFPEYLFDEPILKGTTLYLKYLLDKPKSQKRQTHEDYNY